MFTPNFNKLHGTLAAALIACAGATTAVAQVANEDIDWSDRGDWEWSPEEGYNEEEWYDPTDWFDDDVYSNDWGIDPDADWDAAWDDDDREIDDDSDRVRANRRGGMRHNYGYYDGYYSSYYDGYYDGYNDDRFGYDDSSFSYGESNRSTGFSDGYYDGYYDRQNKFEYDPYYYINADASSDRDRASDRQRRADRARQRGDRMRASDNPWAQRAAYDNMRSARLRGEIESIRVISGENEKDNSPLIVRVRTTDDKTRVLNLGPNATKKNLPFAKGDTVTFSGKVMSGPMDGSSRMTGDDQDANVLVVHTVNANGKTARLAPRDSMRDQAHASMNWNNSSRDKSKSDSANRRADRRGEQNRGDTDRDMARMDRSDRDANRRADQPQRSEKIVTGQVDTVSDADLEDDRYTVVRVNLGDDGETLVAFNAKEYKNARDLDIASGDRVRIQGRERMIGGERVIVASRIIVNGKRISMAD